MAAAFALGIGRYALGKAVDVRAHPRRSGRHARSAPTRRIAHPLAQAQIELELARLMMQKAAALYDAGDDLAAGEAANMAKYAAGRGGGARRRPGGPDPRRQRPDHASTALATLLTPPGWPGSRRSAGR